MIQNRKGRSKAGKDVLKCSIFWQFCPQKMCKSVQKCNRTSHAQKRAAHTHIPLTFQNGFRTHMHMCDHTSHVQIVSIKALYIGKLSLPADLIQFSWLCLFMVELMEQISSSLLAKMFLPSRDSYSICKLIYISFLP